jgi:hypothetical protein
LVIVCSHHHGVLKKEIATQISHQRKPKQNALVN